MSGAGDARTPLIARFALSATALVAFAGLAILHLWKSPLYARVVDFFGVGLRPRDIPFLDMRGTLSSIACWQKGVDVYQFDSCDVLGRTFGGSPFFLRWWFLPSPQHAVAAALCVDLAFMLSLAAFSAWRRRREFLILVLATFSPPVVFALERANMDAAIFVVAVVAALLWSRGQIVRTVSYAIVFLLGAIKLYPWALLLLTLRERMRLFFALSAVAAVLLAAYFVHYRAELSMLPSNLPRRVYFSDMFGAANLPEGLPMAVGYFLRRDPAARLGDPWVPIAVWIALAAWTALQVSRLVRWSAFRRAVAGLAPAEQALMLFGAVLICGCFFVGGNIGYRAIYLLLPLPALLALRRGAGEDGVRTLALQTSVLVVGVMWSGALTWDGSISDVDSVGGNAILTLLWLARELLWWRVVAVLSGILLCFALEAPTTLWLRLRFARAP